MSNLILSVCNMSDDRYFRLIELLLCNMGQRLLQGLVRLQLVPIEEWKQGIHGLKWFGARHSDMGSANTRSYDYLVNRAAYSAFRQRYWKESLTS